MINPEILKEFKTMQKQLNDTIQKVDNLYQALHLENKEKIENSSDTLDALLTEELPAQSDSIHELADTVESILTEIIPSLTEG